ncbi:MAG: hypothetical protein P0Y65_18190 [Candidatus Devosia phytovorans]|uniref:Uncharacterized protein n=1 Tax=Candidatus Devosia phytovorans TaxID=3121372 RepID=A0AAJ5VTU9_9HYPH|nr:hypothetical protein [Devosia sp.]WEK04090.1 MAG: hypothetical protein P0Y65_18190 [Devosia sp.]
MVWELLAMWAIVITTLVWFFRDEKRLKADAELARAASYYAHAATYRHRAAEPIPVPIALPTRRPGGLSEEQRAYLKSLKF